MSRFQCLTNADYSFTNCHWYKCSHESNGSCIYLVNTSSTLTVDKCSFIDCEAESGCGGAIYGYNINKVNTSHSSFILCRITYRSHVEHGGGSVYLERISDEIIMTTSSFVDSIVPNDGAGVNMWYCSCTTGNTNIFQDCKFIKCCGHDEYHCEGGGIMAWDNDFNVGIINSLFSECLNYHGGGIRMTANSDPPPELIMFCLFHQNQGTEGEDINLYNFTRNPISYSFTTSFETD